MNEAAGSIAKILAATAPGPPRPRRKPDREFLILFVARTGSSHLADLLTSAGVGDVREWLNPAFVEGQAKYFGTTSFADYFASIRSACPNGVFGQKMTIWFYEAFSREVRLEDHFNFGVPAVVLFRENIVEQSASLYLAVERNVFHDRGNPVELPNVPYDAARIRRYVEDFAAEERRLHAFVDRHAATARYLSYEQLAESDPAKIVEAIARLVEVTPQLDKMKSRHRKLGDELAREYAERFIAEELDYVESVAERRQWLFDAAESRPLI